VADRPDRAPLASRRYTDKEVARIFKDASELQQHETTAESTVGLSLAELEAVAREAGLDPALVRRAAANLDTRVSDDEKPSRVLGAPKTLVLERTIEGEIPVEEYEVLALEIQRMLGGLGTASTFGRSFQWTSAPTGRRRSGLRVVQVTVAPRNGYTTIRIEEPMQQVAVALFAGSMGGIGMGVMPLVGVGAGTAASMAIGTAGAIAIAGAACVGFLGGIYGIARYAYGRIVHNRSEKLQQLMSRLVDHVSATAVK
jgi:hypothetical protein